MTIVNTIRKWHIAILAHAEKISYPYFVFGVFGVFSYLIYYLLWVYAVPIGSYENIYLRLIVILLCIPLIFSSRWPEKIKQFLPYYWYFTMLYSLPFLFTFLLLKNNFSFGWILNDIAVITLMVLLLDLIPLLIILVLGILLGYLCFRLTSPYANIHITSQIISTYGSVLIVGALFAHKKQKVQEEKLKTMQSLGASIAHELRTPLSSIQAGIGGAKQHFSSLLEGYMIAKNHELEVPLIPKAHLDVLPRVFDNIESEAEYSKSIINMILLNIKHQGISRESFTQVNMQSCIEEALERYPFKAFEKSLIELMGPCDFLFYGDKALMVHIIFNLLKNALYFIEAEKKGKIYIWCKADNNYNVLFLKDTARGIAPNALLKLFNQFYSTTRHGTGLGLAYCKMVMTSFGGDITCESILGEFAQFEMYFPKVKGA